MRTALFIVSLVVVAAGAASADSVAFLGPAGWSHTPSTSTDTTRTVDAWHLSGDVATVTFIKDTTTSYDSAMGAIKTNVTTNHIKLSADKDLSCRGATAHVVEFSFGPDGHKLIVNRVVIPDGNGVDTITYAREDGSNFDPDVKSAETAYCAAT